jgi:hypothetical protein
LNKTQLQTSNRQRTERDKEDDEKQRASEREKTNPHRKAGDIERCTNNNPESQKENV